MKFKMCVLTTILAFSVLEFCHSQVLTNEISNLELEQSAAINNTGNDQTPNSVNSFNNEFPIVLPQRNFGLTPWNDPIVNFEARGVNVFAGDVNGDGIIDYVRTYFQVADERTETISDLTDKTLVYFGGNNTNVPNQVVYSSLNPIGDINGDGYDDAFGRSLNDSYLILYLGSETGLIRNNRILDTNTFPFKIIGFHDFNEDGFDDIIISAAVSIFHLRYSIIFGSNNIQGISVSNFEINNTGTIPAKLDKDVIVNVSFDQPNLINLEVSTIDAIDNSFNSIQSTSLAVNNIENINNSRFNAKLYAEDLNGDGFDDLYFSNFTTSGNTPNLNFVMLGSSNGFSNPITLSEGENFIDWVPIGDLNGDQRIDFIAFSIENRLETFISFAPSNITDGLSLDQTLSVPGVNSINIPALFPSSAETIHQPTDLNADGFDDLQIAFEDDENFGFTTYFGNSNETFTNIEESSFDKENNLRLPSFVESENLGDLNNDEIDDLFLLYTDRFEIFLGGELDGPPALTIMAKPESTFRAFAKGDYNGDGNSDLAIVQRSQNQTTRADTINFYFDLSNLSNTIGNTLGTQDIIDDNSLTNNFILGIENLGDINNDSNDDLIFQVFSSIRKAYIYYGGNEISKNADVIIDTQNINFSPPATEISPERFFQGLVEVALGDINNDGIDDFALSDPSLNFQQTNGTNINTQGVIYVFYGNTEGFNQPDNILFLNDPAQNNIQEFGSLLISGDFNGDGHKDLISASTNSQLSQLLNSDHNIFVYFGGENFDEHFDTSLSIVIDSYDQPQLRSSILTRNNLFGELVTVPDINDDGADEFIFTNRVSSSNDPASNAILVLGGEFLTQENIPAALLKAPNNSVSLSHVNPARLTVKGAIGDFNNDGIVDIIKPQGTDRNFRNIPIYSYPLQNLSSLNARPLSPTSITVTEDINNDGIINSSELNGLINAQVILPNDAVKGDVLTIVENRPFFHRQITLSDQHIAMGEVDLYLVDFSLTDGSLINPIATITSINNEVTSLPARDSAIINQFSSLWLGNTNNNWNENSNWNPATVPGSSDNVILLKNRPYNPTIDNDAVFEVQNLTNQIGPDFINDTACLTIGNDENIGSIVINENLENNGLININTGSSLKLLGTRTGAGVTHIKRNTGNAVNGLSIISPPVDMRAFSNFSIGTFDDFDTDFIFEYDNVSQEFINPLLTEKPSIAKGYFAGKQSANYIIKATGNVNDGDISFPLVLGLDNFNLIGNPYTAALAYEAFINNANNVSNTTGIIYLWNDGGENQNSSKRAGDYISISNLGITRVSTGINNTVGIKDPTDFTAIGTFQGFFVEATQNGEVSFTPDMQLDAQNQNTNFFREESTNEINAIVKLSLSSKDKSKGLYNEIIVGSHKNATLEQDYSLDATKFSGNSSISFYSLQGKDQYAIQAIPIEENKTRNIDLGFYLSEPGSYEINVEELSINKKDQTIYLIDNWSDQIYNLSLVKKISFKTNESENYNERFTLSFSPNSVIEIDNALLKNLVLLSGNKSGLKISYPSLIEKVRIYDLNGKILSDEIHEFQNGETNIKVNLNVNQLYFLKINNEVIKFMLK